MIICAVKHLLSSLLYSRPCANARSIEVGKVLHLVSTGMQIPVHNQDPLYCIYKISLLGLARAGQVRHLKAGLDGTLCFHCRGPRFDPWSGTRKPCGSGKKKKKKRIGWQGILSTPVTGCCSHGSRCVRIPCSFSHWEVPTTSHRLLHP